VGLIGIVTNLSRRRICDQVAGMSCMRPIAPALDVVGRSFMNAQPALSARMTACNHWAGIPDRDAASAMNGIQRSVPQKTGGSAAFALFRKRTRKTAAAPLTDLVTMSTPGLPDRSRACDRSGRSNDCRTMSRWFGS
jgi:hypothetical protein